MTQWWLWLLLIGVAGIWVWGIIQQMIVGQPFGDKPVSNAGLVISSLIPFGLIAFLGLASLKTTVTSTKIAIRYTPFINVQIDRNDVLKAEIITYNFVGYGIRYSNQYGTVYNAKGNSGLLIYKKTGSKLLIGTQKPKELRQVIAKWGVLIS
ncbi:hypothetical protein [Larkinella terrae]|uniref:Bacterial Pleckstrin homology domain-containing protein n=2 Tax=Larkinella terrae TaxID=2025311 RepID=A0A7K0EE28_9BACT|nr:hypothetical protein [Larkinella terrae]